MKSTDNRQLLGLEIVRFGCTLPILLWHYQHFYYVGTVAVGFDRPIQPLFWLLRPFYLYGWLAVQVFWCLSGFIFYWKYAEPIKRGEVRATRFMWLRFSRLYPLHFVTLIAVAGLAWAYQRNQGAAFVYPFQDAKHFVMQLFMASNWASTKDFSYNAPIWSVSIEVLAYVLFFVLCKLHITRPWMLLPIVLVARWATEKPLVDNFLPFCIFMFYVGALTACFYRYLQRQPAWSQRTIMLAGAVYLAVSTRRVALAQIDPTHYIEKAIPVLIIVMVLAVRPRSRFTKRRIEDLGNLTYASYLWHFPIQLAVALWFVHDPSRLPAGRPWFLVAYLTSVYVVAFAGYRLIEQPAQAWLRERPRSAASRDHDDDAGPALAASAGVVAVDRATTAAAAAAVAATDATTEDAA